jgi:hypothetical protein
MPGVHLRGFSKKFEMTLKLYSGYGERWFMKKPKAKNLVTLSLKAEVRPSPRSRERDRIKKLIANLDGGKSLEN